MTIEELIHKSDRVLFDKGLPELDIELETEYRERALVIKKCDSGWETYFCHLGDRYSYFSHASVEVVCDFIWHSRVLMDDVHNDYLLELGLRRRAYYTEEKYTVADAIEAGYKLNVKTDNTYLVFNQESPEDEEGYHLLHENGIWEYYEIRYGIKSCYYSTHDEREMASFLWHFHFQRDIVYMDRVAAETIDLIRKATGYPDVTLTELLIEIENHNATASFGYKRRFCVDKQEENAYCLLRSSGTYEVIFPIYSPVSIKFESELAACSFLNFYLIIGTDNYWSLFSLLLDYFSEISNKILNPLRNIPEILSLSIVREQGAEARKRNGYGPLVIKTNTGYDEGCLIVNSTNGCWETYFCESGSKYDYYRADTETEICTYIWRSYVNMDDTYAEVYLHNGKMRSPYDPVTGKMEWPRLFELSNRLRCMKFTYVYDFLFFPEGRTKDGYHIIDFMWDKWRVCIADAGRITESTECDTEEELMQSIWNSALSDERY